MGDFKLKEANYNTPKSFKDCSLSRVPVNLQYSVYERKLTSSFNDNEAGKLLYSYNEHCKQIKPLFNCLKPTVT